MLIDHYMEPYVKISRVNNEKRKIIGLPLRINIHATIKILNTNKIIENINTQCLTNTKVSMNFV